MGMSGLSGLSGLSAVFSGMSPPTGLAVSTSTAGNVSATWNAVSGATSYTLQSRKTGTSTWKTIYTGATASYTDTGAILRAGAAGQADYRVSFANSLGSSGFSAFVTGSPYLAYSSFIGAANTTANNYTPIVGGAFTTAGSNAYWFLTGSNQLETNPTGNQVLTQSVGVSDVIVSATFAIGAFGAGIAFRYQDDNNYYFFRAQLNSSDLAVIKSKGGVNTVEVDLGTVTYTAGQIVTLTVYCKGSTITVSDGTNQAHFTDTDFQTNTKHGLWVSGGSSANNVFFGNCCILNYAPCGLFRGNVAYPVLHIAGNGKPSLLKVGGSLSITLVATPDFGSITWTSSIPGFSVSGATVTYNPIFEDGGTFQYPVFTANDGTLTGTVTIPVGTWRDFSGLTRDSGNPVLPSAGGSSWRSHQTGTLMVGLNDIISGIATACIVGSTSSSGFQQEFGVVIADTNAHPTNWYKFFSETGVSGNPFGGLNSQAWITTNTLGPCQSIIVNGSYYRYFSSEDGSGSNHVGLITSPNDRTWTFYSGNPVITATIGGTTTTRSTVASRLIDDKVVVYVCDQNLEQPSNNGNIAYYTSSDGINFTYGDVVLPSSSAGWAHGAARFDMRIKENLVSNSFEGVFTGSPGQVQSIGYFISPDGLLIYDYPTSYILTGSGGSNWDAISPGDGQLIAIQNLIVLTYTGADQNVQNAQVGAATIQSSTTGHYLNVATTTWASGNTTYAVSPNGYTTANMTAVPASGSGTITVTVYGSGGVTMTCTETNGVSVSFTLNGMTANHQYTVNRNGNSIGTPTASAGGVLSFTNSTWGTSDTLTVVA